MSERRKQQIESMQQMVALLSHAQNFALGELTKDGGELAFARQTKDGHLAVVNFSGRLVTIDRRGTIDEHPDIVVRK